MAADCPERTYGKLGVVRSGVPDGPGDVLAQPTRARLFAHLASLGRPAGTNELAVTLGRHPSGVRVQLERLRAAGLVTRERVPQLRGRPRDSWSIAPDALPGGEPPAAYRQLARWLARSIPPRPGRIAEVERAGRELGQELASGTTSRDEETMGRMLNVLGFAPQRERTERGRLVFRLGNCPYREAVWRTSRSYAGFTSASRGGCWTSSTPPPG